MKRVSITVPVDQQTRDFVERLAEAEHRTIAQQVRHLIAAEQRRVEQGEKEAA
jgi:CopG-like RHH_1 or ribbon-helix-helix domain, RHH_5